VRLRSGERARPVDHVAPFGHVTSLSDVSCASAALCVGVASEEVVTSTDPAGGIPFGRRPGSATSN
jgi:hypothetical protein